MADALLSILVPSAAVPAEAKGKDTARPALLSALVEDEAGTGEGKAQGFGALLSDLQGRGEPKNPLALSNSNAPQAVLPRPVMVANLVPSAEEAVTTLPPVKLPTVASGAEEAEHAERVEQEEGTAQDLPEINQVAFSLMVTPVAYTSDAKVAAVTVFEKNPAEAAMGAEPQAVFAAFPGGHADERGLVPASVEHEVGKADQAPPRVIVPIAEVAAMPEAQDAVEVNLPEVPVAEVPVEDQAATDTSAEALEGDGSTAPSLWMQPASVPVMPQAEQESSAAFSDAPEALDADGGEARPGHDSTSAHPHARGGSAGANHDGASSDSGDQGAQERRASPFVPLGEGASLEQKPDADASPRTIDTQEFSSFLEDHAPSSLSAAAQSPVSGTLRSVNDNGVGMSAMKLAHAPETTAMHEQIHVRIRQAVEEGIDQISIRLDPPELGKLHIKLDIAQDGRAHVLVTADNRDTFELLQRDARGLERALHEAGVKTDSGSLQFDFRGHSQQEAAAQFSFGQEQRGEHQAAEGRVPGTSGPGAALSEEQAALPVAEGTEYRLVASEGVDIKV